MEIIRWIAFSISSLMFLVLSILNAYWLILQFKGKDDAPSLAPLVGGMAGIIALLVLPRFDLETRIWYIWIPIVLDVGLGYYFIGGAFGLLFMKNESKT